MQNSYFYRSMQAPFISQQNIINLFYQENENIEMKKSVTINDLLLVNIQGFWYVLFLTLCRQT